MAPEPWRAVLALLAWVAAVAVLIWVARAAARRAALLDDTEVPPDVPPALPTDPAGAAAPARGPAPVRAPAAVPPVGSRSQPERPGAAPARPSPASPLRHPPPQPPPPTRSTRLGHHVTVRRRPRLTARAARHGVVLAALLGPCRAFAAERTAD